MSEPKSNHRGLGRLGAVAAAALIGLALTACSSDDPPAYVEKPVEELYNGALDAMQVGDYEEAARLFDEVERQHPYSEWASKAQLMAAYAFYQENAYDEAINALDRFIELHPGSPDVAYAYYLKAISYYEQISDVRRDQKATSEALNALEEVVRRFPESKYSRDSQLKIDLALDHLAGKHMDIGRFYQSRSEYLAAINRFRTVIERYQTTTHVPEALHRLVECYLAMGIVDEAKATAAVLGHNFPGSEWYIDSYALLTGENLYPEESDSSWISGIF
ncbi:outer membrane protein assembly factor BamD [Pelagibius sp. 7325]|uniref:outer membrane protein assembly factor BamD n=1 Tax=Pelagibius sp. 7325 TaxID=3131994 RepID=UPI0030EC7B77